MDTNQKSCELTAYALELTHHKARQMVGTAGYVRQDVEDLQQELALDLLERLPKFDPARATNNTFVARLVERKVSKLIRDRQRERRDPYREAQALNDEVLGEDGVTVEFSETLGEDAQDLRLGRKTRPAAECADLRMDVAEVLASLPPELRPVAEALTTMTIRKAGRKLGISRCQLYKVYLPQIREAFEARGLYEYL